MLWVTYYYWMVQHLTDQYTHLKVQEMHSFMLAFFFLSHPRVFSAHDFVKLPPFRNSYPGSHGTHSSPFPTTVLAFVLVAKKKGSELGFLPWRPLTSTWCAFMQPTSIVRSTQTARRFLLSVRILMLLFQALILTRTKTYISYNVLVVVFFCNTCHIVSTSRDILRIAWYRYRDI